MTSRDLQMMGTIIHLEIVKSDGDINQELDWAVKQLQRFEHVFSANDQQSVLMKVNQAAGQLAVTVSRDLFWLISVGKRYSLFENSNLNIAIGPLVKLWHIGFKDAHRPAQTEIQSKLALTDPHDIYLDAQHARVFLAKRGMEIDLGSLAKGYFADLIVNGWKHDGVVSGIINLGGNVVVIGGNPQHPDHRWVVGLQDPARPLGECIKNVYLKNRSIVTSGIYQRNLTVDHHFYHHLLDPNTGYPLETDLASLSIISRQSLTGELWTSMLFGHNWSLIEKTVRQTTGIQAVAVFRDGRVVDLFD